MFKNKDVAFADDTPKFRYMKKQVMYAVKQYGDGLNHLESMSVRYGTELLEKFEAHGTQAFDPYQLLRTCVASIMMNLAYGKSSKTDVEAILKEDHEMEILLDFAGVNLLLDIFPGLRFILPSMSRLYRDLVKVGNNIQKICNNLTDSRKKMLSIDNPQPKFYIDHFLGLKNKQILDRKSRTDEVIDDDDISFMGVDVLLGGIVTTSNTLCMLLGILVNHPEIQDRAYEEITTVLGSRTPSIEDKKHMPFVEALILEIFRYSPIGPFLIPHYTKKGGELNGYLIPKNTIIFLNIWNLHHDERYWDDPWKFNPLRFIENGAIVPADHVNKQRMLMFGAGRRQCPGEVFAKTRLFILVTMMLQKYKFLAAEGFPKPRHDPREYDNRLSLKIKPYHLCVQSR